MFPFLHALLTSPLKLSRKGKREVGIDASFRLIKGTICRGVSEIKRSECGIRIHGRTVGPRGIQICDIMHEIMVRKETISASGDDGVFVHGCALYICMLIKRRGKKSHITQ